MKGWVENVILHGIFHEVSCFPLHFMLYRGNWITFRTVYPSLCFSIHCVTLTFPVFCNFLSLPVLNFWFFQHQFNISVFFYLPHPSLTIQSFAVFSLLYVLCSNSPCISPSLLNFPTLLFQVSILPCVLSYLYVRVEQFSTFFRFLNTYRFLLIRYIFRS